ncbi:MAG: DUF3598 family protein [Sodalinema sp.]|uniref:DUF3598 family protein n=1 Tax=Sodalinema sp. TaxID=3080550 RepID=UPI0011F68217|nr:MAG: DUF3598 family protein [Phormidium sp. SL48-SHIP]
MNQWQRFLKNLGDWRGSFSQFSPQGNLFKDIPTRVTLEGVEDNGCVQQKVFKYPPGEPEPQPIELTYRTLGRNILFFETGYFSFGSVQFSPIADFGAEQGLIHNQRRLRLVQLFKNGEFSGGTLIREVLDGVDIPESTPLTVDELIGQWRGTVTTEYPDFRPPDSYESHLSISREGNQLQQSLTTSTWQLSSTGEIDGNCILFNRASEPRQLLLLPDGASCLCPLKIPRQQPFFLEIGWRLGDGVRARLLRNYDATGQWVSSTQIIEEKTTD